MCRWKDLVINAVMDLVDRGSEPHKSGAGNTGDCTPFMWMGVCASAFILLIASIHSGFSSALLTKKIKHKNKQLMDVQIPKYMFIYVYPGKYGCVNKNIRF